MNFRNKIDGIREIWRFDNRFALLFKRALFPNETVNFYRYKNIEFLEDHANGDANGARQVIASEMYRPFLDQIARDAPINVLDLGSNNGGFPLLLKSLGFEIAGLACVEMNPKTFSRMRFNIERNFDRPTTLINAAVCGEERDIELAVGGGGAGDSIYSASGNASGTIAVKGRTFDSIVAEAFGDAPIDICKMDVEGAEFEIFASDSCGSITKCTYLVIEIHHDGPNRRESVINKLVELGFEEIDGESKSADNLHYVHFFINKRR